MIQTRYDTGTASRPCPGYGQRSEDQPLGLVPNPYAVSRRYGSDTSGPNNRRISSSSQSTNTILWRLLARNRIARSR